MAMALIRSGALRAALRGGSRASPAPPKRGFASSAHHDDAQEAAKWEKITYVGIATCTILSIYNLRVIITLTSFLLILTYTFVTRSFHGFGFKIVGDHMGALKLELKCPQKIDGVTADPDPDWSFDTLLSELSRLEKKFNASSSKTPLAFTKTQCWKSVQRRPAAFVMRVSDDEMEEFESEGEEDKYVRSLAAKCFGCGDMSASDGEDSDGQLSLNAKSYLMDEVGLLEGSMFELSHNHQLAIKEGIRNKISELESELMSENEKFTAALARIGKYKEARREVDRKLDTQYQRKIAEALDKHLTEVQQYHELKSQIEERKIRSDAANEEAKKKALQEEKLRLERNRAEAEAKMRAEEAKRAALEAERKAAKETAEKEAIETSKKGIAVVSLEEGVSHKASANSGAQNLHSGTSGSNKKPQSTGDVVRAAQSAHSLEQRRLLKLIELSRQNESIIASSKMDFSSHERHIARLIRQIRGTKENVRAKASELLKLLISPSCPQSISITSFAKKAVSHCESPDNAAFACAHVIVLVTSKIPQVMDLLLAEFHKACIYTVPKHIMYSKSVFGSKEAYYKAIGFQEDDGKFESGENYMKRLASYMRLYGALVQTEVPGVQNIHGPNEGWAWLARFLNCLPANMYTAVALNAFLQTAGYILFRRYKSQFRKMLNIISREYLKALREREDPELNPIIIEIQSYIEDDRFLQKPEGSTMQEQLLSSTAVPELDSGRARYY